jgi:diguanylate cyclase (GGDEF)-like protein
MEETQQLSPSGAVVAPLHPREEERIARLLGFDILDTAKDALLDRLTKIASEITGTPVSLLTFIDRDRQWIKAKYGTEMEQSSREDSFCSHTILNKKDDPMIISDTEKDPRFATNPFVKGDPHIRFYAGIPLQAGDGLPIGSLCVIDTKPKTLTEEQIKELQSLAAVAMDYIEVHRSNRQLSNLLIREKEVYNNLLRTSSEMAVEAPTFDDALHGLIDHLDPNLGYLSCRIRNMQTGGTTGIIYNPMLPKDPELPLLWVQLDSSPYSPTGERAKTDFISTGALRPEFSYLVVPVRIRERLVAVIELIYPDHRKMDPRIREVFDIMASNLGIVAERELVNVDLQRQASHDALTGAANRTVFIAQLERSIAIADSLNPTSALLYIDLDGFKEVNDNFGHQTGDRLLVEVTKRLKEICRGEDLLGRLSGDEFVILIHGVADKNALEQLLHRIQRHLAMPFMLGDLEIRIGSSIGCSMLESSEISTTELIRRSEEAMYLVKTGDRKDYCIADKELIAEFQEKRRMDRMIREAVNEKRMFLALQPIVDYTTGRIISTEALLRVVDKKKVVIDAGEFMDSLDRLRILPEVDDWVFAETLRLLKQYRKEFQLVPDFRFSINVSPSILMTSGYARLCLSRLHEAKIPPTMLRMEIIESHLQTSNKWLHENLLTLREAGVRIAVDDFGTGYSNLQYLTGLPIDTIKIDKVFLKGILTKDTHRNDLLEAIIGIAKNLDYSIIAEGVEEQAQADYLNTLGCTQMQGYLYGKPMRVEDFITHLFQVKKISKTDEGTSSTASPSLSPVSPAQ